MFTEADAKILCERTGQKVPPANSRLLTLQSQAEKQALHQVGDANELIDHIVGVNNMGLQTRPRNKYGVAAKADRTDAAGLVFDSKKEMLDWQGLELRQAAGEISELRYHVVYPLVVEGVTICTYEADAVYVEGGVTVVSDSKGFLTRVYRLKKRLMKAIYAIEIKEV
jgi:hypothetical protein